MVQFCYHQKLRKLYHYVIVNWPLEFLNGNKGYMLPPLQILFKQYNSWCQRIREHRNHCRSSCNRSATPNKRNSSCTSCPGCTRSCTTKSRPCWLNAWAQTPRPTSSFPWRRSANASSTSCRSCKSPTRTWSAWRRLILWASIGRS